MKQKANYIPPDLIEKMIDYIPELHIRKWKDIDVEYAFRIAYWCGLRMGEVPHLTKENFDLERKEVYLGRTKTKKADYRGIAAPFIPKLRTYLDGKKPLEQILPNCDTQNIYKWLLKIGEALEIEALITPQSITGEKTKMHIFRKSIGKDVAFGTYGKAGNYGHAQSILGHSNPKTTGSYLRLDIEGGKEYWEELEQSKK